MASNAALIAYRTLVSDTPLWIRTPDHYLPLLYVLGARQSSDAITFPIEGVRIDLHMRVGDCRTKPVQ